MTSVASVAAIAVLSISAAVQARSNGPTTSDDCSWRSGGDSFDGTISVNDRNIEMRVGRSGSRRIVQQNYSGLQVCGYADDLRDGRDDDFRPSDWASRSNHVVFETQGLGGTRRLDISNGRSTFSLNGQPAPVDAEWRASLLDLLDATWGIATIEGHVNSWRGEINSIYGERNSLQGEINSAQGEVNSMQGSINSIRGEENSLRGEINSIQGHVNSLQGEINAEQGSISSLQANRGGSDALIRQHRSRIADLEDEIRRYDAASRIAEVNRRIADLRVDDRIRDIERQIRDFDLAGRTGRIQRRIDALDVSGRVNRIEAEIASYDADARVGPLRAQQAQSIERLRSLLRK
jgi:peptidoglycan hydrolase CwlO-like protein